MRAVGDDIFHAAKKTCNWKGIGCLTIHLLAFVFTHVCEICNSCHELWSPYSSVSLLPPQMLVVPGEVAIKMLLQSHVADEPKAADTALELDALVDLCDCKNIEPNTVNQK